MKLVTFLSTLAALVLSPVAAATEFGGVRDNYATAGTVPTGTCWTVDVWDTGYNPAVSLLMGPAYRFHMEVKRCAKVAPYRFAGIWIRMYYSDEKPTLKTNGVLKEESITRYYNCYIEGRYVKRGCIHIYRKGQVQHEVPPGFSLPLGTGYPQVSVRLNAKGELLTAWWKVSVT